MSFSIYIFTWSHTEGIGVDYSAGLLTSSTRNVHKKIKFALSNIVFVLVALFSYIILSESRRARGLSFQSVESPIGFSVKNITKQNTASPFMSSNLLIHWLQFPLYF